MKIHLTKVDNEITSYRRTIHFKFNGKNATFYLEWNTWDGYEAGEFIPSADWSPYDQVLWAQFWADPKNSWREMDTQFDEWSDEMLAAANEPF